MADLLLSTGRFHGLAESFNAKECIPSPGTHNSPSLSAYASGIARDCPPDKMFGVKLAWHQLRFLFDTGIIPDIYTDVRFIWVTRRDVLAQAVSFSIAEQTNQWSSFMQPVAEPRFDRDGIADRLDWITQSNARFEAFFAATGYDVMRVVYEDIDPSQTVAEIGTRLFDTALEPRMNALTYEHQTMGIKQEYYHEFRRQHLAG